MGGEYFGTDGIRGRANQHPLTPEIALRIGRAVGDYFGGGDDQKPIIMGRDPRISGPMLEAAVAAGICGVGCDVWTAGTIPTPAVAYFSRFQSAAAGVMISASHNPFEDNGIKLFGPDGYKLSEGQEAEIEALIESEIVETAGKTVSRIGTIRALNDPGQRYQAFLRQSMDRNFSLKGLLLVLDCAHGATSHIAPQLFRSLGAELTVLFNAPDGVNINAGCGSEHTAALCRKVIESGAHAGLAFDGDGDRLIAVDETGRVLTGDEILAIGAQALKEQGRLANNIVVATIMSNLGLKEALQKMDVRCATCPVGDRSVMEKMIATGAVLGGENSGHMIYRDHHSTGDGLLSGLKLLETIQREKRPLSDLARVMTVYPQVLENVPVSQKPDLEGLETVQQAIVKVETQLGDRGRVLVRYSGTQSMCRVMVEGPSEAEAREGCRLIAEAVAAEIGE
jgi:phosphoglucosamine mutase